MMRILIAIAFFSIISCDIKDTYYYVTCRSGDKVLYQGETRSGYYIVGDGVKIYVKNGHSIYIRQEPGAALTCEEERREKPKDNNDDYYGEH